MAVGDARTRRRAVLLWSGVGVLLLAAFAAGLGAIQRAYYSPSGFVQAFADSIASHDVAAALAMPGAAPTAAALESARLPTGASRELLRSDILPSVEGIEIASDSAGSDGVHTIVTRAMVAGRPVSATFRVRQTGSVLGLLPTWSFASTPLAIARITVAHASTFTVGRHTVSPRAASPKQPAGAFTVSADYLVLPLAPLELAHTSPYLRAAPVVATGAPGRITETTVDAEPTPSFTSAVQKQVDDFLDRCAEQHVLQPAGCPFGIEIDDRVQGDPAWSMTTYPVVRLRPGDSSWTTDRMVGVAHLKVTVQSLFDGSISTRSDPEPFAMSLSSVTIRSDGSLAIVVAP